MTLCELARLCKLWQKRLRLQDWAVGVKLTSAVDAPDHLGQAVMEPEEMRALVTVRDDDVAEATLVHELLHLRLNSFGGDDEPEQQVAMNLLADAFMRAYPTRRGAQR